MAEAAGLGGDAEQPMHGERRGGQAGGEFGRQGLRALAQGLEHARGGLAGGRGERDAELGLRLEQAGQQRGDSGGLAGAGPAADDGEPALPCEHHRALLPVRRRAGARREEGVEQGRARCCPVRDPSAPGSHPALDDDSAPRLPFREVGAPRARYQRRRQRTLLVEVPAQVKPIARVHHQRMRRAPSHGLRRVDHHAARQ